MCWKWILVLVLLLFLVIFTAQNYEKVEITFLFWSFQTSRAIVLFSTLCVGVLIRWLISFIHERQE